ncbi:MAG TPA: thiamine phosphate synthase [Pirellulales bacterium]|nr:thiamine phosphate synthase [Pirellulales bacterium]
MADYRFTPAAERAIRAAGNWTYDGETGLISPHALLLGLLAEAESRAAGMLAAKGVSGPAVLARWPSLISVAEREAAQVEFSPAVHVAISAAAGLMTDFPRPLELATEHLLLGLVAARDELADWLAERGFAAEALQDEICRLYGYASNGEPEDGWAEDDGPDGGTIAGVSAVREPQPAPPSADRCTNSTADKAQERRTERNPRVHGDGASLLRLIDAAANRAREGLRVVEDFVRFVWNDRHLTFQLKQLRHELARALCTLPEHQLLAARDTQGDVGTAVSTEAERERPDVASVVTANFKRLQEALRSIEEFGKVLGGDPSERALAAQVEQLRYRSYTLERAVAATSFGLTRLAEAQLYVLIDGRATLGIFTDMVGSLLKAGVQVLQLRDKQLADRELLIRAQRLRELTIGTRTLFVMNDRPDLALLAGADGVHVGQEELSVGACRAIVGPQMLIGVSTHSLEQARQAVLDGANYIGVGPTFASRTKQFEACVLRGPGLLRAVNAEIQLPAFAIGGIDGNNLGEVLAAGFRRIAVSGAVLSAEDPGAAAREILRALKDHCVPGGLTP